MNQYFKQKNDTIVIQNKTISHSLKTLIEDLIRFNDSDRISFQQFFNRVDELQYDG